VGGSSGQAMGGRQFRWEGKMKTTKQSGVTAIQTKQRKFLISRRNKEIKEFLRKGGEEVLRTN